MTETATKPPATTAPVRRRLENARELVGTQEKRNLEIDASTINEEARTVDVVYATPTPVWRWWGWEKLAINTQSMRLGRIDAGAAVLWNHRADNHIGIVGSHSVDEGAGKARATLRFSKVGQLANDIWGKVLEGTVRWVSVGYSIHGMRLVEESDAGDTWEINDWEVLEISMVAIGADPNAGVGRSPEITPEDGPTRAGKPETPVTAAPAAQPTHQVRNMPENENTTPTTAAPVNLQAERDNGAKAERARADEILTLGKLFDAVDMAREAVATGKSTADFQRELLKHQDEKRGKQLAANNAPLGLTAKEQRRFSFLRALRSLSDPTNLAAREEAAFEWECHNAIVQRGGAQKKGGFMVPPDALTRAWSKFNTSTSATNTGDTGGNLIETVYEAGSFIDVLRNSAIMLPMCRTMTGLVGNIVIPKKTAASTANWIGEDVAAPKTSTAIGQVGMQPRTLAAQNEITRALLLQSTPDAEALVRDDLAQAIAQKIDWSILYGDPGTLAASPRGLKFQAGINSVLFAGVQPTYAELVAMETAIAADNASTESMVYIGNTGLRGHAKTTLKSAGVSGYLWEAGNQLNGYRTGITNQVAAGDVFLGNWQDLVVGFWGGFEMTTDPYTYADTGKIRLVVFQSCDFMIRRAESFCYGVQEPETP